ncbi:MAG: metallophosphoesterase [Polyangiaceae bacterium]|nr:metallophosphoesterase [Polyangiaceae bacterium]
MCSSLQLAALCLAIALPACTGGDTTSAGGGGSGAVGAGTAGWGAGGGAGGAGSGAGGHGAGGAGGGSTPAPLRLALIGDFGDDSSEEAAVAALVAGWSPDFVVTLGDNNYPAGTAATIDASIGQYYQAFIGNYAGAYGAGSVANRFFPCPGNHDWMAAGLAPYLDYFTLPGNERYYEVDFGLVRLFALDSDSHEPDGATASSVQAGWAESRIEASPACWDLVVFHHAAYSSSAAHGSTTRMRWAFEAWGADAVFGGHDHTYERLAVGGIPYFVNGIGGAGLYAFGTPIAESVARYNDRHGAMLATATVSDLTFELYSDDGVLQDSHVVQKNCLSP